jgi:hypothetical protein
MTIGNHPLRQCSASRMRQADSSHQIVSARRRLRYPTRRRPFLEDHVVRHGRLLKHHSVKLFSNNLVGLFFSILASSRVFKDCEHASYRKQREPECCGGTPLVLIPRTALKHPHPPPFSPGISFSRAQSSSRSRSPSRISAFDFGGSRTPYSEQ